MARPFGPRHSYSSDTSTGRPAAAEAYTPCTASIVFRLSRPLLAGSTPSRMQRAKCTISFVKGLSPTSPP